MRSTKYDEPARIPGAATFNRWVDSTVEFYHRTLLWVLERQRATLIFTILTIGATLAAYVLVPKGFLPLQDTGSIIAVTEAGADVSFAEMERRQQAVSEAIRGDPTVQGVVSVIGSGTINATPNVGRIVITLKPRSERRSDLVAAIDAAEGSRRLGAGRDGLFPAGAGYPDRHADEPGAVSICADRCGCERSGDLWSGRLMDALKREPIVQDISSEAQENGLRAFLDVNRERASQLGVVAAGCQRCAERRLRPAAGLDHLRSGQSVSRGAEALP